MPPALILTIENETSLPDGGPLSVSVQGKRGIDIGRDQYLDWTLPDPTRTISGKHCEVRWRDGAYWLHDISTNGTFLYGAEGRLKQPHRLRNGDRFAIGHYIVVATVSDEDGAALESTTSAAAAPNYDEIWNPVADAAPPMDPKLLKPTRNLQPVKPDFLQWAVDVPPSYNVPPHAPPSPPPTPADDMSWARSTPKPPAPEPEVPPVPTPRRPVWVAEQPNVPWAAPVAGPSPIAADRLGAERITPPSREPPKPPASTAHAGSIDEFISLVAHGAGLPEEALAARNPAELAGEIGLLIRLMTENTRQLLEGRQQAKRLTRSANQTTIQALNNNPLKFAPTAEDALRIMFGPPTRSYLDARRAFTQSFDDLKSHQVQIISAMQHALKRLLADFDPDAIDKTSKDGRSLASVFGSRKARLWDVYSARWRAITKNNQDGMLNAFMNYFAEYYDMDGKDRP